MTAGSCRHRGTAHSSLLHDTQLLFDRVPRARPTPPPQRISRDNLFSEDAHLTPTWTSTTCPLSPSWVNRAPLAMRPKPDAYTEHSKISIVIGCKSIYSSRSMSRKWNMGGA